MKRMLVVLLVICTFLFTGCNRSPGNVNNDYLLKEKNATLIINGKEPSEDYYAYIDHENETAVLPLLTVAQSLGAELKWITKNVVIIQFSDTSYCLDLRKKSLLDKRNTNILYTAPGGQVIQGLPKYVDNDVLADLARIGHFITLRGMYTKIDYENSVIEIYSKW